MGIISEGFDQHAVVDFIVRQQQSVGTACAYLGTEPPDIRGDLEALDQHWTETVRVAVSDTGRIIGAAVIEWDEGMDRSWVHGPWAEDDEWQSLSPALLAAVTTQAPVGHHEMYASVDHDGMAWLASHCGWRSGEANFEYARTSSVPKVEFAPGVRPAVLADEAAIQELHDQEFPGTYARAAELVSPDGPYSTLVIEPEGTVLGYVAFQLQGESTLYMDFIAVHQDARRAGIGVTLIDGAQQSSGRERVVLTVDEHRPEARAFYASLGFELEAATRPYRMSLPKSSVR
ncbi:GNAT family N-acetyltransferase [Brachybacterium tyrofermentans]|uniref:GNAT family N-acetyltransferase n=1 Tax=Brachybacterium tyrofermentans TaxID=47848 RepID=UPI0018695AB4|nr:GNAT family N-acetyltransferase [Brachybacterium tyrofermentans]